jgi:hypothetical protein
LPGRETVLVSSTAAVTRGCAAAEVWAWVSGAKKRLGAARQTQQATVLNRGLRFMKPPRGGIFLWSSWENVMQERSELPIV